tara:strand:- start:67 stop:510 length:444 start_codon:yes stop_codon:yes gene_type:complete
MGVVGQMLRSLQSGGGGVGRDPALAAALQKFTSRLRPEAKQEVEQRYGTAINGLRGLGIQASDVQDAEQDEKIHAGDKKKITKKLEVRDRGGCMYTLSKGTSVTVVRDMGADGEQYLVSDKDGAEYVVPGDALSKRAESARPFEPAP